MKPDQRYEDEVNYRERYDEAPPGVDEQPPPPGFENEINRFNERENWPGPRPEEENFNPPNFRDDYRRAPAQFDGYNKSENKDENRDRSRTPVVDGPKGRDKEKRKRSGSRKKESDGKEKSKKEDKKKDHDKSDAKEKERKRDSSDEGKRDKKLKDKEKKKKKKEKEAEKKKKKEKKEKEKKGKKEERKAALAAAKLTEKGEEQVEKEKTPQVEIETEVPRTLTPPPTVKTPEITEEPSFDLYADIADEKDIKLPFMDEPQPEEKTFELTPEKTLSPITEINRSDSILEIHANLDFETDFEPELEIESPKKVLVPLPEPSKWEIEDESTVIEKLNLIGELSPSDDANEKVTNEVLKRAENAIFARAINAIRPSIEIKKISVDRHKLYSNEKQRDNSPGSGVVLKSSTSPAKESFQITVPSNDCGERSVEIKTDVKNKGKISPVRTSVKDRLGSKVGDKDRKSKSRTPPRKVFSLEKSNLKITTERSRSRDRKVSPGRVRGSSKSRDVRRPTDKSSTNRTNIEQKRPSDNRRNNSRERDSRSKKIDERSRDRGRSKDRKVSDRKVADLNQIREKSVTNDKNRKVRPKSKEKERESDKSKEKVKENKRGRSRSRDRKQKKEKKKDEKDVAENLETKSENPVKDLKKSNHDEHANNELSKTAAVIVGNADLKVDQNKSNTAVKRSKYENAEKKRSRSSSVSSSSSSDSSSDDSSSESDDAARKRKKRKHKKTKKKRSSSESDDTTSRKKKKKDKKSKSSKKKKKSKHK